MFGQKLKLSFVGTAAASALWLAMSVAPANAVPTPLNAWNFNLSNVNGIAWDFGPAGVASGLSDINNIDQITLSGKSTITQTVVGGDPHNQPFTDRGYLRLVAVDHEFPVSPDDVGDYIAGTGGKRVYFTFGTIAAGGNGAGAGSADLTGVLKSDDTIKFTPNVGTISLWLDTDTDLNPTTGSVIRLATFDIVAPSGGSDLNFFGGSAPNATVDITLVQTSEHAGLSPTNPLYTDSSGNDLFTPFTLHLGDVDSKLDNNFHPNPDNSGIDAFGNGKSVIHVNNAGQYNLASVPEPGTLSLLGFGLLISGFVARRRKAA